MLTFFVAVFTAMLYAYWIAENTDELPILFRVFIGLTWGIIVVLSIGR